MANYMKICCALFLIMLLSSLKASNAAFNVVSFGARSNGKTDSSVAFLKAWASACNSRTAATVYVPKGTFLVKPVRFSGPCKNKIMFRIDGKIVAPTNYWSFGTSGFWIVFYKVSRVTIYGGTLDARASSFWACKMAGRSCPPGARSITFLGSSNVVVNKLTTINSQLFHIAVGQCWNIVFQNLKIIAPSWSPNTDGIHIQSSSGITVKDSTIMTGDDCISLGQGSKNIWIQQIACGPGHGISIGSLGLYKQEEGVQDVTVTGVVFTGTTNGVRIKSWARPTTSSASNIMFRNIIMKNVYNPILIDQRYCPSGKGCPNQSFSSKINGVTYENIRGTSASKVAVNFMCSKNTPCKGLKLKNVKLTYLNRGLATASCTNAHGGSTGLVLPKSCLRP
ncbi:Pectin lyase-like superfamily protein [Euphorbia peplus]|nr:Pectin lyase-like superfamily protein [Euphorbia peplus]